MHHDRDSRKEFEEVGLKAKAEFQKRVAKGNKTKPASPKVTKPKTPRPTARDGATSKAKPANFFNHQQGHGSGSAGASFDEYHASEDAVGAGSREDVLRRGQNGRAEASETGLKAKEEFQRRMRHKRAAKNGGYEEDKGGSGNASSSGADKGRSGGGALGQRARDTSNFEDLGIGDRGRLDTNASVDLELSLNNNNKSSKPLSGAPSSSASGSASFDNGEDDGDDGLDFDFKASSSSSSGDAQSAPMERQTSVASSIGAEGFARFQVEDGDGDREKDEEGAAAAGEGARNDSKSSSRRVSRVRNPRKPLTNQASGVSSIGEEGFAAMAGGLGDGDGDGDGLDFDFKPSSSGASEETGAGKAPRGTSGRSPVSRPKGKAVRKRGGAAAAEEV